MKNNMNFNYPTAPSNAEYEVCGLTLKNLSISSWSPRSSPVPRVLPRAWRRFSILESKINHNLDLQTYNVKIPVSHTIELFCMDFICTIQTGIQQAYQNPANTVQWHVKAALVQVHKGNICSHMYNKLDKCLYLEGTSLYAAAARISRDRVAVVGCTTHQSAASQWPRAAGRLR